MTHEADTDPAKIAARVVKGLVTMRGAAVKLHTASVDRHRRDMRMALSTIDNEYFMLRDYLNQLVSKTKQGTD
jgi:hypothetical protein